MCWWGWWGDSRNMVRGPPEDPTAPVSVALIPFGSQSQKNNASLPEEPRNRRSTSQRSFGPHLHAGGRSEIHSMLAVCHFASRVTMSRKMLFESNRLVKHRVDGRDGGFWSELVS